MERLSFLSCCTHPDIASGVECGLLLSQVNDYDQVQPWWGWLCSDGAWDWCITAEDRDRLLSVGSYAEAYNVLARIKGANQQNDYLRELFQSSTIIYDKTPAYVYQLPELIQKIDAPFVVTLKSWEEIAHSYRKRGKRIRNIARKYRSMLRAVIEAYAKAPARLLLVSYESLTKDNPSVMKRVAAHFQLPGNHELSLHNYNERFGQYVESRNTFHNDAIRYEAPDFELGWLEKLQFARYQREFLEMRSVLQGAII